MSFSSIKHLIFFTLILSLSSPLCAGDGFPAWDYANLFKQDLKRATLVTNLPNITESDHFIGVQFTGSQIFSNSLNLILGNNAFWVIIKKVPQSLTACSNRQSPYLSPASPLPGPSIPQPQHPTERALLLQKCPHNGGYSG